MVCARCRKDVTCKYCGQLGCQSCIIDQICHSLCSRPHRISLMTAEELRVCSAKELKDYIKLFSLPSKGLVEKEELVQLIRSVPITRDQLEIYKMNRRAEAALGNQPALYTSTPPNTNTGETSSRSQPAPTEKKAKSPNFGEFFTSAFKDVAEGFKEVSSAFKEVGDGISAVFGSPTSDKTPSQSRTTSQSSAGPRNDIPPPNNAGPSVSPTVGPSVSPTSGPSHSREPSIPNPMEADPPSLTTILANGIDLNSLTTKTLKRILLRERVSTLDINDREELIKRVRILVQNVGKEMAVVNEDQLCKICCEK
jgi:hypothetical protein